MTFAFATPVSAVGGDLLWGLGIGNATISVFDSSNNLIESFLLTDGSSNFVPTTDSFYGFSKRKAQAA
jgi:hypothetical protein